MEFNYDKFKLLRVDIKKQIEHIQKNTPEVDSLRTVHPHPPNQFKSFIKATRKIKEGDEKESRRMIGYFVCSIMNFPNNSDAQQKIIQFNRGLRNDAKVSMTRDLMAYFFHKNKMPKYSMEWKAFAKNYEIPFLNESQD